MSETRRRLRIADELMKIAARKSIQTVFGWVHPDCVTLQEAARLLRGEEIQKTPEIVEGVLS